MRMSHKSSRWLLAFVTVLAVYLFATIPVAYATEAETEQIPVIAETEAVEILDAEPELQELAEEDTGADEGVAEEPEAQEAEQVNEITE